MIGRLIVVVVAAALATTPTVAGSRQGAKVLLSDEPRVREAQEKYGWADAVVSGDTVYVSGVIAASEPGDKGMEPAFTRAFERLGTILRRAGASWDDVVEVRSYHTDPVAQFDAVAAVKMRYIKPPHPAWTAVGTPRLLQHRGLAEIALVARLSKSR